MTTRVAVIGAGHLGQYHAAKYAASRHAQLVAVVDVDAARARAVAGRHGAEGLTDWREALGRVDAVSIATPAAEHCAIACACLEADLHVLVEKPIAVTLAEADHMVKLARARRRTLQVGHVERFNPVMRELARLVSAPRFIECHRLAPFKPRGTDVDVLLDLIASLAGAEFTDIDACGAPVLCESADIANARIRFANGCTANITSSRVSGKVERKLRVFQRDAYFSADLGKQELTIARKAGTTIDHSHRHIPGDALEAEIESFLEVVRDGGQPVVGGEDGRLALQLSLEIAERLRVDAERPAAPHARTARRAH